MLERNFQARLIKELEVIFPDCIILKNDASYRQGIPDLILLYGNFWAALEVKASLASPLRPNQAYYVEKLDEMSFAAFICPENKERIIHELQQASRSSR